MKKLPSFHETFSLNENILLRRSFHLQRIHLRADPPPNGPVSCRLVGTLILPVPPHLASAVGDNAYTKHIGAPAMRKYVVFALTSNWLEIWLWRLLRLVIQEPNMSFLMIWIAFKVYISKMTIPA
ncbi:hypothetical protein [Paenibacillus cineris]|uniref:hypothetical protein n=1 Tax=Paenibacillus cineris TaxID=237530 RepID=UPI001BB355BF|nr:hypothetical protein [Paenibacillus cineris]